jgi:hypothetical protein
MTVPNILTARTRPDAGWHRGPTGTCRFCGLPVTLGERYRNRRTFHAVCAEAWMIQSNPGYVRRAVGARDHGVCARCGLDCWAVQNAVRAMWKRADGPYEYWDSDTQRLISGFIAANRLRKLTWQAHHIRPVAEGGGLCGLDGYETLCARCHAVETGALRRRLNLRQRCSAGPSRVANGAPHEHDMARSEHHP